MVKRLVDGRALEDRPHAAVLVRQEFPFVNG
jgi:hypothetical protein